ncbi:MAG: acetyl-CoA carboxylase biotin carboxyl carrier protein [Clostridia bacterium]|nr:acetyl-CoA carboxylase biotin carboxyl carrier protein [Clostridia bacterium]
MNEKDIRKYASLMKELELTGLEITEDNKVVRLERNVAGVRAEPFVVSAASQEAAVPQKSEHEAADCITVKSPMVGVFYAAPAENADPFVSLGDRVEKGKTLCIIEAMKLMNEICADESGVITEICVTNGQVVEYGTELFKIKR